jgi:hypothetical protein
MDKSTIKTMQGPGGVVIFSGWRHSSIVTAVGWLPLEDRLHGAGQVDGVGRGPGQSLLRQSLEGLHERGEVRPEIMYLQVLKGLSRQILFAWNWY